MAAAASSGPLCSSHLTRRGPVLTSHFRLYLRFHYAWHSLLTNHETSQPTQNQRLVLPHFIFSSCPKKMYLSSNTLKKQIRGKSLALLQKPPVFLKTKDQPVIMYLRKTQKTRTCEKSDLYPLVSQINGVQQLISCIQWFHVASLFST